MIEGPAFILGNGPTLPVDKLWCLKGLFTIGINRIWLTGFTPTVHFFDGTTYKRFYPQIENTEALALGDKNSLPPNSQAIGMDYKCNKYTKSVKQVFLDGNSGVAAAKWAIRLGCNPVYLLGMTANKVDGKAHYYDTDYYDFDKSQRSMHNSLKDLERDCKDIVQHVTGGQQLREIADSHTVKVASHVLRAKLRQILEG